MIDQGPTRNDREQNISLALLKRDVDELRTEVQAQTKATKDLVDAWRAASKTVAFIKWLSTLIAALGVLWLFAKQAFVAR